MALLSIWGILLVVLGHSGFEEPIIQQELAGLHSWIYSFHMPLFFFISGFLFSYTNVSFTDIKAEEFLKKKVLRLLVPYFVLGTILFFIKYAFSGLSHATRDFSVATFFKMFIAPHCDGSTLGYLWYLITLFMVFVVVVALCKCRVDFKKTGWCIAAIVAFLGSEWVMPSVIWLNMNAVVHYIPYFFIGILVRPYVADIQQIINRGGYCNMLIFIALSIVLTVYPLPLPGNVTAFVRIIVGIWMSLSVCTMALKSDWVNRCILPFGDKTYSIYLLSWFGQYAAKVVVINILDLHWTVCVVAMFVGGIVVPLFVDWIVDKTKLGNYKPVRLIIGY